MYRYPQNLTVFLDSRVKCYIFELICLIILICTIAPTTVNAHQNEYVPPDDFDFGSYYREGDEGDLKETWMAWVTRHIGQLFSFGSASTDNDDTYQQEPPDPNEGWVQWSKRTACQKAKMECCFPPDIRIKTFTPNLKKSLDKEFFGQHLAAEIILHSISGHWRGNPRRALVLSFHGPSGTGKNYLAERIASALFKQGEKSKYYKHFSESYDFQKSNDFPSVKARLQHDLLTIGRKCEYALFVFDEVDQMPATMLDALVPFIDYPGIVGDVSFRKAIFILLNNVGSRDISTKAYEAWKNGTIRESLTIHDFENIINMKSFNERGNGLYKSKLIEKHLIDYAIPFLPMERRHVSKCVEHEAERQGVTGLDIDAIVQKFQFWPPETPVFSTSGCKKVERAVTLAKSKQHYNHEEF